MWHVNCFITSLKWILLTADCEPDGFLWSFIWASQLLHNTLHSWSSSRCICSFQDFRTCLGTCWKRTTSNLLMMKSEHSCKLPPLPPCCGWPWRVLPQHFQFKDRDQSASHSARGGRQHCSASHGPEGTVSILSYFLLRVSSSFSLSFPSPAVPDIAPGQERNPDRCPGWNDLLQHESWILPQQHLLRSQPARHNWVRFVHFGMHSCSVMQPCY